MKLTSHPLAKELSGAPLSDHLTLLCALPVAASRQSADHFGEDSLRRSTETPLRRKRHHRAFTLLEILISMAILTMVIGAIYNTWMSIVQATQKGEKAAAEVQRTRMAVQSVEGALAGTTMFAENIIYYSFDVDTTGDFALLSFVSRLPDTFPGSGMFPGMPLRRVTFSVEPGEGGNNLIMRQQPVLEVLEDGQEAYAITLARNLSRFEFEFWDTNVSEWAYEWLYTNQLPPLVRATMAFADESGRVLSMQDVISKVVALPSEAVTRDFQVPLGGGGGGQGGGDQMMTIIGPNGQPIQVPVGGRGNNRDGKGGGDGRGDGRGGGQPGGGPRTPGMLPPGGPNRGGQGGQPGQFPGQGGQRFGPGGGQGGQGGQGFGGGNQGFGGGGGKR